MQVLNPAARDRLRDDRDPELGWLLPNAIEPALDRDGVPEVLLTRSEHGAVLRLRLLAHWPAVSSPTERLAPWSRSRFRLVLAAETTTSDVGWREGGPAGGDAVDTVAAL